MGCLESKELTPPQSDLNLQRTASKPNKQGFEGKVVLLGDSGVGKSSLALRFCQGRFPNFHEVTIGAAFLQQVVKLKNGPQVKLHIWDTGGQERFRSMSSLYYRDAAAAVLVYDCTDGASFEAVKYWLEELKTKGPERVVIAVAGNKSDAPIEKRVVDEDTVRKYCSDQGLLFFPTSALSGQNVPDLFESISFKIASSSRA